MAFAVRMRYTLCMDIKDVLRKIEEFGQWPAPFAEGAPLWDDEYISSHMLMAHLDESHDKASYRKGLRERIAQNIIKKCNLKSGDSVLDLGCGPGLYAKGFAKHGIKYMGVDISTQSIGYAMAHRGEFAGLISYTRGDYTQAEFEDKYDCAIMIWCDFGALSPAKRDRMLGNVHGALKSGGMFCFDVYAVSSPFDESSNGWKAERGGFWNRGSYTLLERSKYYESVNAGLYHALVISEKDVKEYMVWDKRYGKKELAQVLVKAGFSSVSIKKGGLSGAQRDMYGVFLKR